MGYYSTLEFYGNPKCNLTKEDFKTTIDSWIDPDSQKYYNITLQKGEICFEPEEYYQKWYNDEDLCKMFAELLSPIGYVVLAFVGEDADRWGWFITKGNYTQITYTLLEEVNGESISEIIKRNKWLE